MAEALAMLQAEGIHVDAIRVRAFPFSSQVDAFIEAHDTVFVVEQNESAQLRTLLINEREYSPKQLVKVLHYDGTPITASFIAGAIRAAGSAAKLAPQQSHG
jgi:2-oxoglutarate ferredoxin oxidoreductase subunit alpha